MIEVLKLDEKKDKWESELKMEKNKQYELDNCISKAGKNYRANWLNACETLGKLSERCLRLIDINDLDWTKMSQAIKDEGFESEDDFEKEFDDCTCLLPSSKSERVEEWRIEAKDRCVEMYGK